jgi:hypothetical protein
MAITPGILADGILPSFTDDLYVSAGDVYVSTMIVSNTGAATRTVNVAVYDATSQVDRQIIPYNLQLSVGDTLYVQVRASLNNGDKLRGIADNNTDVDYVIFGGT